LSVDTERDGSFFPHKIEWGAFAMPSEKTLNFLSLSRKRRGSSARFGRFPDGDARC
jgi:hypothetical protein